MTVEPLSVGGPRTKVPNEMLLNPALSILSAPGTSGPLTIGQATSMAGPLTLAADPVANLHAATKQYVDTKLTQAQADARYPLKTDVDPYPVYLTQAEADARYQTPGQAAGSYLPLTGGTLSGPGNLTLAGALTLTTNSIIQGTAIAQNFRVEATQSNLQLNSQTQSVILMTGSNLRWQVSAAGHFLASTDAAYDIGASGASRPRDVFIANNLTVAGNTALSGSLTIGSGGLTLPGALLFNPDNTWDIGSATARPRDIYVARNIRGRFGVGSVLGTDRTVLQAVTANSWSSVSVMPTGTDQRAFLSVVNSSNPSTGNYGYFEMSVDATTTYFSSIAQGSQAAMPIVFLIGAERMRLSTAGILTVSSDVYAGGTSATNSFWATAYRFGTSGATYYLDTSGNILHAANMEVMSWGNYYFNATTAIYIGGWDGTYIHLSHSLAMNGGTLVFSNNGGVYIQWNGATLKTPNHFTAYYLHTTDGSNGIIYSDNGALYLRAQNAICYIQDYNGGVASVYVNTMITNSGITIAGAGLGSAAARGYNALMSSSGLGDFILGGAASQIFMHPNLTVGISQAYPNLGVFGFSGISCNGVITNSARRFKSDIETIHGALDVVLDPELEGTHYTYNPPHAVEKNLKKYGLIADAWHEKVPEAVFVDHEGLPTGLDYQQVTAILFQAFKEYVEQTDERIATLEARLKEKAA